MKIAAVVVTYNRLNLLKECINGIRKQTRKVDEIIVVNNSSTDGTLEWLQQQNDLTVITQPNLGSSGGQYTGIKTAYEKGYDWIWCMDDDGYPTRDCLKNLIESCMFSDENCLNSLVIDPITEKLSFHIPNVNKYNKFLDYYYKLTDSPDEINSISRGGVYPWGMFFNSTLISRKIVEQCGLPKKELFIWGDEVEYFYRIKKKFNVFIISNSIFYHPKKKSDSRYFNSFKYHHFVKNVVFINRQYKKFSSLRNFIVLLRIVRSRQFTLIKYFLMGYKLK